VARILIVDDDADILDMLKDMLSPEHEVVVALDAVHALEAIRASPPDVLVTDIRMPGHNGFILIQQAKALCPGLPVVVISAYYDETDDTARQIVHRYAPIALSKPITRPAIVEAIAASLAGRVPAAA
jgi:DNA-binding NtrC family response regulator